jgi:uncharacterized membrane protein
MKQIRLILAIFAATAMVACGGGGGSNPDLDGDGIPNISDAFPNDPSLFADFTSKSLVVPGGEISFALAVNDAVNPLVVGTADQGTGILKAVHWTVNGTTGDPASAITLSGVSGDYSAAFAVNDDGVIAGESEKGAAFVPVIWAAGAMTPTELSLIINSGTLEEPITAIYTSGSAYGINRAGQIVGELKRPDGSLLAVFWNTASGEPVELPSLGGLSASAHAISNGGWVVGESITTGGMVRATLWEIQAGIPGPAIDLDLLPGHVKSIALGVDDLGRIVGESEDSNGDATAVVWRPKAQGIGYDAPLSLGANSSAQAINEDNRIVGYAGATSEAAIWDTRLTTPTNLDKILDGTGFSQAYGQNATGIVVGIEGNSAFLAIPR